MVSLSLIAALARNRVIGRANRLPWHLPEDLKRFRQITWGRPVIMGRKTHQSILQSLGGPLPGRDNIVVTRSAAYSAPGCRVAQSLAGAVAAVTAPEAFVIGGAQLYAAALPFAARLYLTEIHAEYEGDAFFPAFDRGEWREFSREARAAREPENPAYDFAVYERIKRV